MAVTSPDSEPTAEMKIGVPPFLSGLALEQPIDMPKTHAELSHYPWGYLISMAAECVRH
jgi:hypothetical protein